MPSRSRMPFSTRVRAASLRRFKTVPTLTCSTARAPEPGEVVVQKALAETFRQVAAEGADVFYKGAIADRMVRYMEETGGLITKEDLVDFVPVFVDPSLHQLSRL